MSEVIATENAPKAIGAYSQAVKAGGFLFVSGQIGMDSESGELVSQDFKQQARQVFENIRAILQAANCSFADVVKFNVSLTDMNNFQLLNEVFAEFLSEPYPARAAVEVRGLPKACAVEIETIALTS